MLFTTTNAIPQTIADAIFRSIRAVDALAKVQINSTENQVEVDSALTAAQVAAALKFAGCDAREAGPLEHVSGGSNCCGGCS